MKGFTKPSLKNNPHNLKVMTMLMSGEDKFPDIKLPRKRRVPSKRQIPNKTPETALRRDIIKYLRCRSCHVFRIEPAVRGKFGCGDLFVFCLSSGWAGWVELKSWKGSLSPDQVAFQNMCGETGVKYIIVRCRMDCEIIFIK